ncbi:LysE/ArgO family amino acid transporter [Nocardioides zeae]|uniref:LysE/ArgO family amino acid transporter n=1 Tax=Nocardioides imazamoxiresistens TaxID=3231893 RepID=A0ABU3PVS7_9ACTN|nr:LysE/ArgO family amino acid transporter [Nocardioides zeae]MDT9593343.1 LysE/ArgO family amino acid transporter [Nocardioides zeae]
MPISASLLTVGAGLLTGLSLIVAIGAQNAFVLRQGVLRRHVAPVVAVCATSDALLIVAGVAGVGTLLALAPTAIEVLRWGGVAFLTAYGVLALRRAARPGALVGEGDGVRALGHGAVRTVATALALTWLNPHVYLDTVLMLGSIAQQEGPGLRWWFAGGAVAASVLWFSALGYGASRAHRLLARPATWRVLETVVGVVMLVIAVRLALSPVA